MSVVKSFAKAGESAGVSSADAYNAAIGAVISVVEAKVDQINLGVASGGATTLLNFTNDMATVLTNVTTNVQAATGYDAGKAASFTAIASDAKTGLDVAVAQIKALVEPTDAASTAANAKIISAANVVATQIAEAAQVITDGGSLAAARAKVTITDVASFTAVANNPAPTGMTLSGSTTVSDVENVTVSEDAASLVVGTVTGVDGFTTAGVAVAGAVSADETFTYAIVGGPTVPVFTINATTGVLSLAAQPDYETMGTNKYYEVSVSVTDSGGKSFIETFKVNIGDVDESGAFGISSDTVTFTDYVPATLTSGLVAGTSAKDLTNSVMSSTTGSQVTLGSANPLQLNLQNLKNLFDDDAATVGKSPNISFTLDTVPTGSGSATIKATIIDGADGTRTTPENEISVEFGVTYLGNGTAATITATAADATGSYTKGDGTSVSFTIDNTSADVFGVTAGDVRTGVQAKLDIALGPLYDAFIAGAGRADLLEAGTYSIAVETTLPLQNYANETVTKFTTTMKVYDGTDMKNSVIGTNGNDTIVGTAAAEVIIMGAGTDTVSTGAGADYIILASGMGSTTLANANTITGHLTEPTTGTSGFTNGVDKFALADLTFADLTVAGANSNADTNVSITATGEYLMTIVGLSPGYVLTDDFVDVDAIV
jgi:hypothetical protein